VRQTARFGAEEGQLISLMWENDYASTPLEGTLTDELRKLIAGVKGTAEAR
jgi:hypothetical protein